MSYQAQTWANKVRTGSSTLKHVLLVLANYADEHGACWPSQERLAFDTEMSDRSIRTALKALEEQGLIRREKRFSSDHRRLTDKIYLLAGNRQDFPVEEPPEIYGKSHRKIATERPEKFSDKPIKEPPKREPSVARGGARDDERSPTSNVIPISKGQRAHRLPRDFALTPDRLAMGLNFGLTEQEVRHVFEEFCDYWWGCGKCHLDWDCTLRNRFRLIAERRPRQAALGADRYGPVSIVEACARGAARAAARRLSREQGDGGEDPLPF